MSRSKTRRHKSTAQRREDVKVFIANDYSYKETIEAMGMSRSGFDNLMAQWRSDEDLQNTVALAYRLGFADGVREHSRSDRNLCGCGSSHNNYSDHPSGTNGRRDWR